MPLQPAENAHNFHFHNVLRHNGFYLPLGNGYHVSVQWDAGNYCDNYGRFEYPAPPYVSNTAEIAFKKDGELVDMSAKWGDDVKGYCTLPDIWQEIMEFCKEHKLLPFSSLS